MTTPMVSLLIYYDQSMSKGALSNTIKSYARQRGMPAESVLEMIILLDDLTTQVDWDEIYEIQGQEQIKLSVIEIRGQQIGPGKLWNEGMKAASAEWIVFSWSGVIWDEWALHRLKGQTKEQKQAVFTSAIYEKIHEELSYTPTQVGLGDMAIQHLAFMNTIPLCALLVSKAVAQAIGGFNEAREYARIVDWEFTKRLSQQVEIAYVWGTGIVVQNAFNTIKFDYAFTQTVDEQIRRMGKEYEAQCALKVAIVGGWTEGAQIQLCLLNYLELVQESFSYRQFVTECVNLEELAAYDRVFLVRGCSEKSLEIARFCIEKHIKIIYLLDDNWFCITQTYPQMEAQMGRRSTSYLYFTLIISIVDEIWVYNERVKEDIKPFNTNTYLMPVSIALKNFDHQSKQAGALTQIGFAGSASKGVHFEQAFRALVRIMEEFETVKLYFKGIAIPVHFQTWGDRVVQENYDQDYKTYAKSVSRWQCDIMISPLGNTRYINSKCINKYLEITAVGAVGIYTDIPLYQQVIVEGENGLLVPNEEEAWYSAIKQLIVNPDIRKSIKQNAYEEVRSKYATEYVLPLFLERIQTGIQEESCT